MKPQIGLLALMTFLASFNAPWLLTKQGFFIWDTSAQAQTNQDQRSEALRLYQLGEKQLKEGQFREALETFEQVLIIVRAINERQGEGLTINNIGVVYERLGQYPQALKYFQQALVIDKQVGNKKEEGTTLNNIGLVYRNLGQYPQALKYLNEALVIRKQIGNKTQEGATLNHIGAVYNSLGQYPQALKYLNEALVIRKQVGNKEGEGTTLNTIGQVYNYLGQYPQALKYLNEALVIHKQVGNKEGEGSALNSIGQVYESLGQYPQALKYFQQALVIAKEVGSKAGEEATLTGIGQVYNSLGQYPQALKYLNQALVISKQVGNKEGKGSTLNIIGSVYQSFGQYTQALNYYQQALVIAKQVGDKELEGATLNNIGEAYNKTKQYPNAEKMLLAAIQVLESLRQGLTDADKISIFDTQAYTYIFLQHALIAQNKTNTALEISERGRARAFVELLSKRLSGQSTEQLTIAPPKAQQLQQIAKEQNATLIQYSIIYDSIPVRGILEFRESRLFIWVIPPTGRIIFRWVDLKPLLKQNTSLTQLAPNSPSFVPTVPNSPTQQTPLPPEAEQKINTSWSQTRVIILLIVIGSSVIGLVIYCGRFVLTKKATTHIKLKQRLFVPSLLILSAVSASGGLIFLMTQSQPLVQKRNFYKPASLEQLVSSIHQDLGTSRGLGIVPKGQKTNQENRLKQLHTYLIKPIADLLPTNPNDRIIFVPQSALFLVPFPALQDESGKYLIEKHTILTAPSIQVLELTRKQQQRINTIYKSPLQAKDALIVGNPTMPSVPPQIGEPPQQLPSLPGAENEAKAIASLLKTQAIIGNQATKKAILQKISTAPIVHFATHGLLDERRALSSAIALAPEPPPTPPYQGGEKITTSPSYQGGEKITTSPSYQGGEQKPSSPTLQAELEENNGLLTAEEILDLKLNAQLVVLSACDTGRGKITGDGVVGLSRSLISAGVPSIVVSLWSVPDAPTASLMTKFYSNLQQNPDRATALRQAMLTTMKQHPNPRDWAAFTLIGEAK